jgi:cation diffusion facilitator family transporter
MMWRLADLRLRVRPLFRRNRPEYASTVSLIACVVLAIGSIILGAVQQSLVIQTNGYISLIDIGNSLLFLTAVQRSARSADVTFNYGYGKYESLAILVSANLLIVLGIFTIAEAFNLSARYDSSGNTVLLMAWSSFAFVLMRGVSRLLKRYANRFHMPMLRYDAELWRVDSLVELGIIAEVILVGILLWLQLEEIALGVEVAASLALVAITLRVPLRHGREALQQLLDRTLPDEMQYEILAVISENASRMCAFKSVHTRQSGKDIFIEIDLVMPYDYTLGQLYVLERGMIDKLHERFPTAIPRVYVTPCDGTCNYPGGTNCPVKALSAVPQSAPSD